MSFMNGNSRAEVNPQHPEAWAICDRCGFLRNHKDLRWQEEWRGNQLMRTGFLVCQDTCLDIPYQFARPQILPPDPVPVQNARPASWAAEAVGGPAIEPSSQLLVDD